MAVPGRHDRSPPDAPPRRRRQVICIEATCHPGRRPPDDPNMLRSLRRGIRWAVRRSSPSASPPRSPRTSCRPQPRLANDRGWPPLALLLTIELVSRVPVHRPLLVPRRACSPPWSSPASPAAWVVLLALQGVANRYGETDTSAYLLPISVDGLIVVASISLVELAGRIRSAEAGPATLVPTVSVANGHTVPTGRDRPPVLQPETDSNTEETGPEPRRAPNWSSWAGKRPWSTTGPRERPSPATRFAIDSACPTRWPVTSCAPSGPPPQRRPDGWTACPRPEHQQLTETFDAKGRTVATNSDTCTVDPVLLGVLEDLGLGRRPVSCLSAPEPAPMTRTASSPAQRDFGQWLSNGPAQGAAPRPSASPDNCPPWTETALLVDQFNTDDLPDGVAIQAVRHPLRSPLPTPAPPSTGGTLPAHQSRPGRRQRRRQTSPSHPRRVRHTSPRHHFGPRPTPHHRPAHRIATAVPAPPRPGQPARTAGPCRARTRTRKATGASGTAPLPGLLRPRPPRSCGTTTPPNCGTAPWSGCRRLVAHEARRHRWPSRIRLSFVKVAGNAGPRRHPLPRPGPPATAATPTARTTSCHHRCPHARRHDRARADR